MVRFVFFDLGKVLFDFDYGRLQDWIIRNSRLNSRQLAALLADDTLIVRYETGELTTFQFLDLMRKRFALAEDLDAIQRAFNEIFSPLGDNLAAAGEAADRLPTGILSNTSVSHIEFLRKQHPFLQRSDLKPIYSYEILARKPDEAIYRQAMRVAEVAAGEILYIDDLEANIRAAEELGWQAVHLTPDLPVRAVLEKFGVLGS